MIDRKLIRPLWWAGALFMMTDGLTTYVALSTKSQAQEVNPLGVWAIDTLGLAGMCVAKVLIGVFMVYRLTVIADRGHRHQFMNRLTFTPWRVKPEEKVRRGAFYALVFTVSLMALITGNNIGATLA